MKTKEELDALKNEVEALNKKLTEFTEEELKQVVGGTPEANDQTSCPLANEQTKTLFMCRNYPCVYNLMPLQGRGYRCPITNETFDNGLPDRVF